MGGGGAAKENAVTVKNARCDGDRRIRGGNLIELAYRVGVGLTAQNDLHGPLTLECNVRADDYVRNNHAAVPLVPMAVVVRLKSGIRHKIAVEERKNGERR